PGRRNPKSPLKMRKLSHAENERRVRWIAELLALGPLLDRLPRQLSGGQRQRVAMGRALVREPSVSLLDEPLSNLDAKLRVQVRAEIKELQARTHTTMLYVTHDQVEAMTLGDRVAVPPGGGAPRCAPHAAPATGSAGVFVGTPPMNLFPARVVADGGAGAMLAVGARRVPIAPADVPRDRLRADLSVTAGVRPEAV